MAWKILLLYRSVELSFKVFLVKFMHPWFEGFVCRLKDVHSEPHCVGENQRTWGLLYSAGCTWKYKERPHAVIVLVLLSPRGFLAPPGTTGVGRLDVSGPRLGPTPLKVG